MLTRRSAIAATAAAAIFPNAAQALLFRGGTGVAVTSGQLATMTIANTSGSTQAANFVSPIFGWPFKKGDIPTGTAPIFKVGSTAQPYSWGCQVYWSDGSLKFASFMLRCSSSIAGSGTLGIDIYSGGTAPSASARTLTEVYNQSIQVNAVAANDGSFTTGANLSGTWNAVLASNANNVEQYVYLNGDAGKVWRATTNFVQSGSAHGQLICYHYIAALTDNSGNLGGFRYLPRICQPWYDVNSPAKNWRVFGATGVTWQHGAGPTSVAFNWPYTAGTFTWTSGATFTTTASNNYATGSTNASVIPVYFTTTGTLPAPLNTNQLYWARIDVTVPSNNFTITDSSDTEQAGWTIGTNNGSGTHTVHPAPYCLHFGNLFSPTTDGKWNYFQGTGSLSADQTVRTQIDKTYWHSTKCIPPYDTSLTPDDNNTSPDWTPQALGFMDAHIGATGERGDIGPLNLYSARHFYLQTANNEKLARVHGYAQSFFGVTFKDSTTRQLANLSNTSYTGMPAPDVLTTRNKSTGGFTAPPAGNYQNCFEGNTADHRPELIGWCYMNYAEPQFFDLVLEAGNMSMLTLEGFGRSPNLPSPGATSITTGMGDQLRELAWATRDQQLNAGLAPVSAQMPDGSHVGEYLKAQAAASLQWVIDTYTTGNYNSYVTSSGLWIPSSLGSFVYGFRMFQANGWMRGYFLYAICWGAMINESANASIMLTDIFARWYNHSLANFGGYQLYNYYEWNITNYSAGGGWPPISSDAEWNAVMPNDCTIAWGTGHFTATNQASGWALANGDKFMWNPVDGALPAEFSRVTSYYAVGVSGATFGLSATLGGSPIVPSGSGTGDQTNMYLLPAYPGPSTTFPIFQTPPDGYGPNVHGGSCWAKAILGTSDFDAVIADAQTRMTAQGVNLNLNPKYAMQSSF